MLLICKFMNMCEIKLLTVLRFLFTVIQLHECGEVTQHVDIHHFPWLSNIQNHNHLDLFGHSPISLEYLFFSLVLLHSVDDGCCCMPSARLVLVAPIFPASAVIAPSSWTSKYYVSLCVLISQVHLFLHFLPSLHILDFQKHNNIQYCWLYCSLLSAIEKNFNEIGI